MKTKYNESENMVNEEYFREFGRCILYAIIILIAFAVVGCIISFT